MERLIQTIQEHMFEGEFGLEKECLRVYADGRLANSPHPFSNPRFDRDFAEPQLEMITKVCSDEESVLSEIAQMDETAQKTLEALSPQEYLHPSSIPPATILLPPEAGSAQEPLCIRPQELSSVHPASFSGKLAWKSRYRADLLRHYGAGRMLLSGIHFNFSWPAALLAPYAAQEKRNGGTHRIDRVDHCPRQNVPDSLKDQLYLRLAARLYQFAYLPVLLFASAPGGPPDHNGNPMYASVRCGRAGYWNEQQLFPDFSGVCPYIDSVETMVLQKKIELPSELYLPVRLKSGGTHSMEQLCEDGISYIEYRLLDLDPLSPHAVRAEAVTFLHDLMIYLTLSEGEKEEPGGTDEADGACNKKSAAAFFFGPEKQREAMEKIYDAALFSPSRERIAEGRKMLLLMADFFRTKTPERFRKRGQQTAERMMALAELLKGQRHVICTSSHAYSVQSVRWIK